MREPISLHATQFSLRKSTYLQGVKSGYERLTFNGDNYDHSTGLLTRPSLART